MVAAGAMALSSVSQCGDKLAEVTKDESVGCSDILLCGDLKSGIVGSNTD
jgi:hypothetical protein